MRIGIDCRFWGEAGVGRYVRNLVWELSRLDKENDYFLLLLKKDLEIDLPDNFYKIETDIRWYTISEQIEILKVLNKLKLDLVHFPHFNIPIFYQGKFIVTIHDLIHKHFSMSRATSHGPVIYKLKKLAYDLTFKTALNKSRHIITVSNYVKDELIKSCNISQNKITTTYEAVEENFIKRANQSNKDKDQKILKDLGINSPYIFYVGNAHPHKNVEGLINSFKKISEAYPDLKLVLSGHDHYFWERVKIENPDKNIIYTGFISDDQLIALYKSAEVYVFPSFEEGFGLPLLEAMSCGVPVVSSNKGSLTEIGGDAAVYFDPYSIDDMVAKITEILNSKKLQKELIQKGEKRVKEFSFQKMAQETLEIYKSLN